MQILYYLIVVILVAGKPVGVKFKDFDTFANETKLKSNMTCEEFSGLKNRDTYIKKYFEIKDNASFEPTCVTSDQFNEWILTLKTFKSEPIAKPQTKDKQIITNSPTKEYTGILRYKEPSTVKSVEAYSSTSFYLELSEGTTQKLQVSSSESVSYDTLKKFIDSRVHITAKYIEELPNPNESYPLEMTIDGKSKPMTRKFHSVISVKPAK